MLLLGAASTACGVKQFVTAEYVQMLEHRGLRVEKPIARELRYAFLDNSIIDGREGNGLFATSEGGRDGETVDFGTIYAAPEGPDLSRSDALSRAASEASRRGDYQAARTYAGLSVASAETATAMNQMVNNSVAMMSAYSSTMSALRGLAEGWHEDAAVGIADRVLESGCIGPEAPEGSVLHLMLTSIMRGQSFQAESTLSLVSRAVLEDGRGGRVVADRAIEIETLTGEPEPGRVDGMVPYTADLAPPMEGMPNQAWVDELATLALSAVQGIYAQSD